MRDSVCVFIGVQQCVEHVQRAVCFTPPQSRHRCQKKAIITKQTNKQKSKPVKEMKEVKGLKGVGVEER